MSIKLLGDFAALLQSPIKWYNEQKSSLDLGLLDGYVDLSHALAPSEAVVGRDVIWLPYFQKHLKMYLNVNGERVANVHTFSSTLPMQLNKEMARELLQNSLRHLFK